MKPLSEIIKTRPFSIFQALFVTILWSSSWPIMKLGLEEIPPLFFAGLRYFIASLILVTIVLVTPKNRKVIATIPRKWWLRFVIYGLIFYSFTQGAQFVAILYLEDTITVSLLLSFTPILVLILAIFFIKEKPNLAQILFVLTALVGALLYFHPFVEIQTSLTGLIGLIAAIVGLVANALSTIMGRAINKVQEYNPLVVTTISMLIGSVVLLVSGIIFEEIPVLSLTSIGYILWLSFVNTAFAFTLWNNVMQKLQAVEISIINNTMLVQIAILALIFLNERPSIQEWIGVSIVAVSALLLQIFKPKRDESQLFPFKKTEEIALIEKEFQSSDTK
ncbi:MAG: EamA family transporter [Candidatus Heimdallarchaeota archaeon]|nr:EamA family transporter [Candidatus Heimdallarchaeota archaeon]